MSRIAAVRGTQLFRLSVPGLSLRSLAAASNMADVPVVDAQETVDLQQKEGFTYLDVRTQDEFSAGHAPGAVCIPVMLRGEAGEGPTLGALAQRTLNTTAHRRAADPLQPPRERRALAGRRHRASRAARSSAAGTPPQLQRLFTPGPCLCRRHAAQPRIP